MNWLRMVCAVVLAVGGVAACTQAPQEEPPPAYLPGGPGQPASTLPPGQPNPLPPNEPNEADLRYVQDMIMHHQQAIDMALLAPERAARDDVKRFAERMAGAQGPEIEGMNGWLRQHNQPTIDPRQSGHAGHSMSMPGMATPAQLEALRAASGPAFDTMYLQLMIAHHEGALTMARTLQTSGRDVRVQEMANDVIAVQTDEINTMRELLGQ
jgi:uncharacterized protein (DUF305 family)